MVIRALLSSGILILSVCGIARGQSQEAGAGFDVASIKPSDPGETVAIKRSGYHLATSNTSLEMLVEWAYDVYSDHLFGKPAWMASVHYDIVANAPQDGWPERRGSGQPGPLQLMMQTLLADRFKLLLHRETRELPMYALVVAKTGPKVRPTELVGGIGLNPFSMPGKGRLTGTQVTAEMLANVLSGQLGHSVQDQTGLKGVFDFMLEWEPDPPDTGPDGMPAPPAGLRMRQSLSTALQEQLGLRLEARKGPVEVLVIDHIERTPTEN